MDNEKNNPASPVDQPTLVEEPKGDELVTTFALYKRTGLARETIRRRLARLDPAKVEGRQRHYRLHEALELLVGDLTKPNNKGGQGRQVLECRKLLEQVNRLRIQNDILHGKYWLADEVRRDWLRQIGIARRILLDLPDELAPALAGLDPDKIHGILDDKVMAVIDALREGWE